jgi:rod shape determining protein RodA
MIALFTPVAVVLTAGLVTLASVSWHSFTSQLLWAVLGASVIISLRFFDWRAFFTYRWLLWVLYGIAIALLVVVLLTAPVIRNTRSWLTFGSVGFQPVEFVKLVLILVYASYFSRRHLAVARWRTITESFLIFALPAGLTVLQPDLGSALVLFGIWFGFLLFSGLPRRRVFLALAAFLVIGAVGWQFALRDYHRERIIGLFYPERNALTYNYSVIQSKIAIGSAGLFGKGYGQGSQTQLGFLSEPEHDFVISAFIEEWGIVPGLVVIGAFLVFLLRILRIGARATRNVEKFICLGAAMVFGIHFLLNAGSAVGFMPVVGVPFPFLSYGGSHLLMSMAILGMVDMVRRDSSFNA